MAKIKLRHHKNVWLGALLVLGSMLLAIGGLGLYDFLHRTQTGISTPNPTQVVTADNEVSEKKPEIPADYKVPNNQPRLVRINAINSEAYIQRVGVKIDGVMAAPNNIYFAGWYVNGVAPGDSGVSIINGHAGGRYEDGIFRNLYKLSTDDSVSVQMGDLSWREFSVVSVTTYSVGDASGALFKDDPMIDKELHLITCDGTFDDTAQTYDKRTIVVARFKP